MRHFAREHTEKDRGGLKTVSWRRQQSPEKRITLLRSLRYGASYVSVNRGLSAANGLTAKFGGVVVRRTHGQSRSQGQALT